MLPGAQMPAAACAPAATAADADRRACPASSDAAAEYGGRGGCAPTGSRRRRRTSGRRRRGFAPAAGGAGGCTMRGCVTCGRFAGASGRAGCGVLPGSSMRSRIVGGTNRPAGDGWRGATVARGDRCRRLFDRLLQRPAVLRLEAASGTITTGGASSTSTGGGGSTSTIGGGGGAATATGTSTGRLDGLLAAVEQPRRVATVGGHVRLDDLDETRRTEDRRRRLRRFGLLQGRGLLRRRPWPERRARRTCRRPEARCFAAAPDARRTSARRLPRLCSRRSSARFRDRA